MIAHRKKKAILIHYILFLTIALFLCAIAVMTFFINKEKFLSDKLYPNIYIDNQYVGEKTPAQVKKQLAKQDSMFDTVHLYVFYKNQPVATFSAQQLSLHSNLSEVVDQAYTIGRTPHLSSRIYQKLTSILKTKSYHFTTTTSYDHDVVKAFASSLEDQYNKPAKNALFTFENGRVSSFRLDEDGLKIDTDNFLTNVDKQMAQISKHPQDATIYVSDEVVHPDITLSKANNLGIEELIGVGKSDFSHSIESRIHNVTLGASRLNGVIIEKGKTFSFDDAVGDISAQTGFEPAYVISNGKTVLGDGGGICQVSTTMFRAALNTGLPIVERTAHAYRVGYYENDAPLGLDATIFSPSVDLKIKNDTDGAILIQTEIDQENHILTFNLYGKKDNRKVELSTPVVTNVLPAPPPIYQDDPTLPTGVTKQVDFAAGGATSTFHYKVTKDNKVTFEKTFVSVYRPWAAAYLVGTGG